MISLKGLLTVPFGVKKPMFTSKYYFELEHNGYDPLTGLLNRPVRGVMSPMFLIKNITSVKLLAFKDYQYGWLVSWMLLVYLEH